MTYREHLIACGVWWGTEIISKSLETEMSDLLDREYFWTNRREYCKDWIAQSKSYYELECSTREALFCVINLINLTEVRNS